MKKNIPIYNLKDAVSGISINRVSDEYIGAQFNELAQFHRNDFYMFFILKSGSASFIVDFKELDNVPGTMVFLYPGQIQRIVSIKNSDGWVLFFDNKLMDERARQVLEESLHKGGTIAITEPEKEWLFQVLDLLSATSRENEMGAFQRPALLSLLLTCIYKIASIHQARVETDNETHSVRTVAIINNFRKLVRENFTQLKHPADYADLMNLSLGYLNDTVKKVSGFTVSYYIQQQTIKEAQRLLCHSDFSVNQIADKMGFEDPKYFSRFFTKSTGLSPKAFRKEFHMQADG